MTLERYAELRARLNIHGENDRDTLDAFALTDATKGDLQSRFARRFSTEPGLLETFAGLVRDEMKRLRRDGVT